MPRALPAGLLALLLAPGRGEACPACYLPHSLADSVRSARDIYVCQVVRAPQRNLAEVKVTRVLRGPLQENQHVETPVPDAKGHIGKALLVIHPADWPTLSPPLGAELEDEVRFLMQSRPRIATVADAVRRVEGVSTVTTTMGLQYIRRHRKGATDLLIQEIDRIKPLVFSGRPAFWDEHRLENLLHALLVEVDPRTRAYVLGEVQGFLGHPWRDLNQSTIDGPSVRAVFLERLLSSTKKRALRREMRHRLEEAYANLAGEGIASTVYALACSSTSSPASFKPSGQAEKDEAVATGLYLAGSRSARAGLHRESRALLARAKALTQSAALRAAIDEGQEAH